MHAQTSENDLLAAFRNQLHWLLRDGDLNPFRVFNPVRPFMFRYNQWKMRRFISRVMDRRFASRSGVDAKKKKTRPVIDLALDAYLKETNSDTMDTTFKRIAIDQIRTFMFAGHDTTSSAICYIAYMLYKYPEALQKVRQEYDEVFGTDVTQTAEAIKKDPYLLNKLPYSVAIIKEILRLFPPASTVRNGVPGFFLQYDGKHYPTEGKTPLPISPSLAQNRESH